MKAFMCIQAFGNESSTVLAETISAKTGFHPQHRMDVSRQDGGRLDVAKLVPFLVDSSKLSDILKNDVFNKDVYNAKIKYIGNKLLYITNLATNTTFNTKINEGKNKMPNLTKLVTNASLNTKIDKVKNKIPDITNFTNALTAVENKVPHHSEYITTPEIYKLTVEHSTGRLRQANLATKGDIADFVIKIDFDDNLKKLKGLPQTNQNIY